MSRRLVIPYDPRIPQDVPHVMWGVGLGRYARVDVAGLITARPLDIRTLALETSKTLTTGEWSGGLPVALHVKHTVLYARFMKQRSPIIKPYLVCVNDSYTFDKIPLSTDRRHLRAQWLERTGNAWPRMQLDDYTTAVLALILATAPERTTT